MSENQSLLKRINVVIALLDAPYIVRDARFRIWEILPNLLVEARAEIERLTAPTTIESIRAEAAALWAEAKQYPPGPDDSPHFALVMLGELMNKRADVMQAEQHWKVEADVKRAGYPKPLAPAEAGER